MSPTETPCPFKAGDSVRYLGDLNPEDGAFTVGRAYTVKGIDGTSGQCGEDILLDDDKGQGACVMWEAFERA